jgi:hypothetical protein
MATTAREIPNYWKYAETYTPRPHVAPIDSWTLPAHL